MIMHLILSKMEEQKTKIELLENENQQWQILAQKLNSENSITETEHRIAELEQQVEKGRDIDERIQRIKERRTVVRTSALDRGDTGRTGTERPAYRGTEDAAQRISDLEREIKQREQSRA